MSGITPRFWYTESLQAVHDWRAANDKIMGIPPVQIVADQAKIRLANDEDRKPVFGDGQQDYMMQRYKNVALINISGSLVNRDSWYNRYYGMVSYQEIRRSVLLALADPAIDGILAMMNTPGGSASGADSMASFFSKANKRKPFYAYAESDMCSGGYYLGAPARQIYAQRAAQVGSIGVVMVHFDILKMYQEMGVEPTVFREGEFKALGTPYEHLDKKSKETIGKQLKSYFDMFNEHVTVNRNFANSQEMRDTAGEGRVFMAEEAKEVGLVDYVAELEDTLEDVSQKSTKAAGKRSQLAVNRNYGGSTMGAQKKDANLEAGQPAEIDLDEQTIAALASGAPIEAAKPAGEGDEPAEPVVEAAKPAGEGDEPADPVVEASKTEGDTPVAEAPKGDVTLAAEVTRLSRDLGLAEAKLSQLETDKATLQTQLDAQKATLASQRAVVAQAVTHRQAALGFQPNDTASMSDDQLLALYGELDNKFKERYSPGQRSNSVAGKQAAQQSADLTPGEQAAKSMVKI